LHYRCANVFRLTRSLRCAESKAEDGQFAMFGTIAPIFSNLPTKASLRS
jgi:hypothetical protein